MYSWIFDTPRWSHNFRPISGFPMLINKKLNFVLSKSLSYCRICSWQNGQPNDRVRTTKLTPSVSKFDTKTWLPSSRHTIDFDRASLGLMSRASSDGEPEIKAALPHPQSWSLVMDEKRPATDASLVVMMVVAAGAKAVVAAVAMRAPTTRFLIGLRRLVLPWLAIKFIILFMDKVNMKMVGKLRWKCVTCKWKGVYVVSRKMERFRQRRSPNLIAELQPGSTYL